METKKEQGLTASMNSTLDKLKPDSFKDVREIDYMSFRDFHAVSKFNGVFARKLWKTSKLKPLIFSRIWGIFKC